MTTLIIRYDDYFRATLEEGAFKRYLAEVERLAVKELAVDIVDIDRIVSSSSALQKTRSSEILHSDGAEMTQAERSALKSIEERALQTAKGF
jgi:hypothetical protein